MKRIDFVYKIYFSFCESGSIQRFFVILSLVICEQINSLLYIKTNIIKDLCKRKETNTAHTV